jgi:hypothetical protein
MCRADYVDLGNQKRTQRTAVFELSERCALAAFRPPAPPELAAAFATAPFPCLALIEHERATCARFARHYRLRSPKQPAGISNTVPVRPLNIMAITSASGQPRELVTAVLRDLFAHAGETGMTASIRLDVYGVGSWLCQNGQCRFQFSPEFSGEACVMLASALAPRDLRFLPHTTIHVLDTAGAQPRADARVHSHQVLPGPHAACCGRVAAVAIHIC